MRVLFDTETKITAFLDSDGATVVHPVEETVHVSPAGVAINMGTGKPLTSVPGYVSELATMLTNTQSVDAGKPNPTQTNAPGQEPQRLPFINGRGRSRCIWRFRPPRRITFRSKRTAHRPGRGMAGSKSR